MMEATGCGHKIDQNSGIVLATKSIGRFGNTRAIRYSTFCKACANEEILKGNALVGDEEQTNWLHGYQKNS